MQRLIRNLFTFIFFGPLFQLEPFQGWIMRGVISTTKLYKRKYRNKLFIFNLPSTEVYKFLKKFWFSKNEEIARNFLLKSMRDNDVFLNVGSHIGTFVVFANKFKKLKKTICIEASGSNVSELMQNISLNGINNVQIFHAAAGNEEKFVEFFYESFSPGYYNGRCVKLPKMHKQKKAVVSSEFIQMKKIY